VRRTGDYESEMCEPETDLGKTGTYHPSYIVFVIILLADSERDYLSRLDEGTWPLQPYFSHYCASAKACRHHDSL